MIKRRRRPITTGISAVFCLCLGVPVCASQSATTPAASEESLRSALRLDTNDLSANRQLADLLERTGRPLAALTYRRHIAELAAKLSVAEQTRAQLDLGIALVEANDAEEAIPVLRSVLAHDPSLEKAQYELGTAFAWRDNFTAALAAYKAAAELDPHDADTQLAAAKSLITLLRYKEAEPFLAAARLAGAAPFDLHLLTGMVDRHTDRLADAVAELQAAISLQPDDAEANLQLAESLRENNQPKEALSYFKLVVTLRPSVPVYFGLASLYRSLGMSKEEHDASQQLKLLREAEAAKTKVDVIRNQAVRLVQSGDLSLALAQYRSAIALDPGDADLLVAAASLASRLHQAPLQRALLQQALNSSPRSAPALSALGTLEAEEGKPIEAKAHLTRALQYNPQLPQALNSMAVLIAREGQLSRAEFLLQQAVESDPKYHEAFRNLGLIYASTNQPSLAETAMRRSLELDPTDANGWVALGELFLHQQQGAAAAKAFRRAVDVSPENLAARLLFARSLMMGGDKAAALREVDFILQRTPSSAPAMQLRAEIIHERLP